MGQVEAEMAPLVYQMNHANESFKVAAKQVRIHIKAAEPPRASSKGAAKPKAKPKARQ